MMRVKTRIVQQQPDVYRQSPRRRKNRATKGSSLFQWQRVVQDYGKCVFPALVGRHFLGVFNHHM